MLRVGHPCRLMPLAYSQTVHKIAVVKVIHTYVRSKVPVGRGMEVGKVFAVYSTF